jgi:3-phenylpropionate/trans-cinnamate dioxygenase ferredoxin subunit
VGGHRYLVLQLDGAWKALDGTCTHEEADLGIGFLTGGRITCPLHLSQFDLDTGEALTPPAEAPLRTYKVKLEGGRVWLEV